MKGTLPTQVETCVIPAIETFDLSSTVGPPVSFCIAPTDTATRSRPVGAVSGEAAVNATARRYQLAIACGGCVDRDQTLPRGGTSMPLADTCTFAAFVAPLKRCEWVVT